MKNSTEESPVSAGTQAGECPLPSTKTPRMGSSGIPHLAGESEDSDRLFQLFSLLGLCTADVSALGRDVSHGLPGSGTGDPGEGELGHCEYRVHREGWQGEGGAKGRFSLRFVLLSRSGVQVSRGWMLRTA